MQTPSPSKGATHLYRPTGALGSKKLYLLVLLAGIALYGLTAQHGVAWQDSGMHQWRVLNGEFHNPLGLALAHPLYIAMGQPIKWLAGEGMPTWLNAWSGLGMAITLANVYLLGFWLTGRHRAGLLAAAMLGVAHTAWWLATITETYCWVTAGLSTELLLLVWLIVRPRWWKLALLGLVNGLGFSLHDLALLPLAVYALTAIILVIQGRLPWWSLLAALGCWAAGAGLMLELIIQEALASGDWRGAIRSALVGREWGGSVAGSSITRLGWGGVYILLNWPFLSLLPVLVGWWVMGRQVGRGVGSALGGIAAILLIFGARYDVPDQFMFLLPSYVLFAVGAAVGIDRILLMGRTPRRLLMALIVLSLAATPVLYGVTPIVLDRMGKSIRPNARALPGRDENRYWITPWKMDESSAQKFAVAALGKMASDGVFLADNTIGYPVLVVQRLEELNPKALIVGIPEPLVDAPGQFEDVFGRFEQFQAWLAGRPLYVLRPQALEPAARSENVLVVGTFVPDWPLHRVELRPPAATGAAPAAGAAPAPNELR